MRFVRDNRRRRAQEEEAQEEATLRLRIMSNTTIAATVDERKEFEGAAVTATMNTSSEGSISNRRKNTSNQNLQPMTTTTATTNSFNVVTMNATTDMATASSSSLLLPSPRLLAQDAVKWYMEELDPYETHSTNIRCLFRPIVLSLTLFIMEQPHTTKRRQSWRDYLDDVLVETTIPTSPTEYKKPPSSPSSSLTLQIPAAASLLSFLDSRSMARLEAFVNGVLLALPSVTLPTAASSSNNRAKTSNPARSPQPSHGSAREQQQRQCQDQETKENIKTSNSKKNFGHSVSLLDGLAGFNRNIVGTPTASLLRSISGGSGGSIENASTGIRTRRRSTPSSQLQKHVQIRSLDLQIRLELYLRTIFRVVKACLTPEQPSKQYTHCVLAVEPPRALKARVEAIATAFSETVGTVRQQGPVLTKLISLMTMELLAVPSLSEGCKNAIRRVVVDYEHQTSFASLAFLSTPEDAANQKLVPLLQSYFETLQQNWKSTVRDCELETMLQQVLDPEMRSFFKTVEFMSIGHLLETCASYRSLLQRIELPPKRYSINGGNGDPYQIDGYDDDFDEAHVRQAIRDLQRERITINGSLLPPVKSRSELLRVLSQTLNFAMMSPKLDKSPPPPPTRGRSKNRRSGRPDSIRRSESAPTLKALSSSSSQRSIVRCHGDPDDRDPDGSGESLEEEGVVDGRSSVESGSSSTGRSWAMDMSTVDRLTKRLLLAASRTGIGGDAYFIVSDLFGGKDVQVFASPDLRGAGGAPTRTLEIWLHLGSLTIQCHTSFDVYPKLTKQQQQQQQQSWAGHTPMPDPYSIVDCCEPLIQLHTTTTEVIALQEVRAADARSNHRGRDKASSSSCQTSNKSPEENTMEDLSHEADDDGEGGGPYVLQERITPKTGWKTLSIRPALYEKLQVWTTPS